MTATMMQLGENESHASSGAAGWADASERCAVEVTGADRAKFLHNLCSNDVLRLTPGQGCEAFLLNAKGRIVGHVFAYVGEEAIWLDSSPGQGARLIAHLDRYIIREKVELRDRTSEMAHLLLVGPRAAAILESLVGQLPRERLGHRPAEVAGGAVSLRRSQLLGEHAFSVVCAASRQNAVVHVLENAGAVACGAQEAEAARIEAGTPLYGTDIGEDNLPQEVDRNPLAISFTKGCYLGQETVARIDALGHVNRTLAGMQFASPAVPPAGCELTAGDAVVGRVTSAALSPRRGVAVALGYLRPGHNQPGQRLASPVGDAEVVSLPMP